MITTFLLLITGVVLLYFGAEALVRGSSALALRLGLPAIVVGLTVVAYGTSAPEFVVSVDAALTGHGGVALGNVVGATVLNLTLVLGFASIIRPLQAEPHSLRLDAPMMAFAALLAALAFWDGVISRVEGAVLIVALVIHASLKVSWALRHRTRRAEREILEEIETPRGSAWWQIGWVCAGLVLLTAGANALLLGALDAARAFGIDEAIIGLTVVAIGTTLPELITALVAAWRGETELLLGNVVGSCICNVCGILGAAAVVAPLHDPALHPANFYMMLGATVLLAPMLWTGRVLGRREGVVLLAAYAAYLGWMWPK